MRWADLLGPGCANRFQEPTDGIKKQFSQIGTARLKTKRKRQPWVRTMTSKCDLEMFAPPDDFLFKRINASYSLFGDETE